MLRLLILLLITSQAFAQPNVWLSGHLIDGANEEVEIVLPLSGFGKDKILVSTTADKNGDFSIAFRIERGQPVKLIYLKSSFLLYLHPNDSLKITASQRIFDYFIYQKNGFEKGHSHESTKPPTFEGKAAALNHFLYKNGLHGRDSLRERPIIEHATAEQYATMMEDIADYTWTKYQKQFGLTDSAQAVYVQASLAGQSYLRKLRFGSDDLRELGMDLTVFTPSFKISQNDAARDSDNYLFALTNYLKISYFNDPIEKYEEISVRLKNIPKTCEIVTANFLVFALGGSLSLFNYDEATARFEKDFPNSDYTYGIKQANWANRLFEVGIQFPEGVISI